MHKYLSMRRKEKAKAIKNIEFYSYAIKIFIVIAAVTYNTWVFTPYLNTDLNAGLAFVSEYASATQPNSIFFRIFDIITGLIVFFVLFLFLRIRTNSAFLHKGKKIDDELLANKFLKFVNIGFAINAVVFSACTIIDVILPMQCPISATPKHILHSPQCETLGNFAHEVTSALVGIAAVAMIIIIMVWGESLINFNNPSAKVLDLKYKTPIFIFGIIHCVSISYTLFGVAFPEYAWLGYGQRISIISLSLWAIFICFSFLYYKLDVKKN